MRKNQLLLFSFFLATGAVHAQTTFSGTWQGTIRTDTSLRVLTMQLEQDGTALSGSVRTAGSPFSGGLFDVAAFMLINDGEIDGGSVTMKITDGSSTGTLRGTIAGDELTLNTDEIEGRSRYWYNSILSGQRQRFLLERVLSQPRAVNTEVTVSLETLADYVGTYALPIGGELNGNIRVSLENDRLAAELISWGKFPLFAESETNFFLRAEAIEPAVTRIEFVREPDGGTKYIVMRERGRIAAAERVPEYAENRPVPHGEIRMVWYASSTLGTQRRMHVYTPPG